MTTPLPPSPVPVYRFRAGMMAVPQTAGGRTHILGPTDWELDR